MKRTRLKSVSKKKRQVMRDRSRVRKMLIQERGNICELKFHSQCSGFCEGLHEPLKQSALPWAVGDYEAGRKVFLACNICNQQIENEPERAKAEGFSVSRFDPDAWTRP
jgi:hypothetical protein